MARDWYCYVLGQELGPMEFHDLRGMVAGRQLGPEDQVRRDDDSEWHRAGDFSALFPKASPATQPAAAQSGRLAATPATNSVPSIRSAPRAPAFLPWLAPSAVGAVLALIALPVSCTVARSGWHSPAEYNAMALRSRDLDVRLATSQQETKKANEDLAAREAQAEALQRELDQRNDDLAAGKAQVESLQRELDQASQAEETQDAVIASLERELREARAIGSGKSAEGAVAPAIATAQLDEINIEEEIKDLRSADRSVRVTAAKALAARDAVPDSATDDLIEMMRREVAEVLVAPPRALNPGPVKHVPLQGNEISLARIKANPQQHVGKRFYLVGYASIEDYYNYGYADLGAKFYCVRLIPLAADGTAIGQDCCYVYVLRTIGVGLAERLTQCAEDGTRALVRFEATIQAERNRGVDSWNMFETDGSGWQYYDGEGDWLPPVFEGVQMCYELLARIGKPAVAPLISVITDKGPSLVDGVCCYYATEALSRMDRACLRMAHARLRTLQLKPGKLDSGTSYFVGNALSRVDAALRAAAH